MPTADDVLALATADVGLVESPPNTNQTKHTRWYGLTGPWCAMAVSYWFHKAGLPLAASTSKGFAYTPSGAAWFQQQKRWTTKPARGHVVFFDFPGDGVNRISHVGIVEKVNADGSITTIEANTSPGDGGSQRDGGGVYRRIRRTGVVGYGVPAYTAPASPPADQEDDEMKPYIIRIPAGHCYLVHADAILWIAGPATLDNLVARFGQPINIDDHTFVRYKLALNADAAVDHPPA